ncbi:hypothetical protein D3C80_2233640 [compost metagenome]
MLQGKQDAITKSLPGNRVMREPDCLVGKAEDNFMMTHDAARSNRLDVAVRFAETFRDNLGRA